MRLKRLLCAQARNTPVTDKNRGRAFLVLCRRSGNFEIESAHTQALLPSIGASVARANHHPLIRRLFATKVNHRVSDIRVAADAVRGRPKKQVTRFERIEFEGVVVMREHGLEISGFAHPNVLLACITWDFFDAGLREHVINETRAIHPTIGRVGRAIFVTEILRR
jgi:hypothetical protein